MQAKGWAEIASIHNYLLESFASGVGCNKEVRYFTTEFLFIPFFHHKLTLFALYTQPSLGVHIYEQTNYTQSLVIVYFTTFIYIVYPHTFEWGQFI